ncbi:MULTISPECIES: hypothetical protein [unclassified Acinetobacter]|uniref:hypothetical protein n=1 Tax=unclassified Acinetobacter TaxID=196816 RepID=UPI001C2493D9|nr:MULTISPECIES: hypothetical protein [unclassified Acinetobacter]
MTAWLEQLTLIPTILWHSQPLPWAQLDDAGKELERTVKELGFKGALLNGRPSSHFIDYPDFNRLLECFNTLGVPLYLQPRVSLSLNTS